MPKSMRFFEPTWWVIVSCLLGLLGGTPRAASAAKAPVDAEGRPFLRTFTSHDHGGDPACWGTVQDARGVLYVGNKGCVLEYDGTLWRKVPVGELKTAFGLAVDAANDTIFVGTNDDLGYLGLAPGGERTFVSLLDQLPADARQVGEVRRVHVTPEGVFFVGSHQLMRWRDGHFKVWKVPTRPRLQGGWAAGHFYLQNPEAGLLRLDGDALVPASQDPVLRQDLALAIVDGSDPSTVLLGTLHHGLLALREGAVQPVASDCADFLKEKEIRHLRRLRDGSLAVATGTAGLVLLDAANQFRNSLRTPGELPPGNILGLLEDAENGLWISMDNAVVQAEIHSPLSIVRPPAGEQMPLVGDLDEYEGNVLLTASQGLYHLAPADAAHAVGAHLERLPDIGGIFLSLCRTPQGLLAAGRNDVFQFRSGDQPPSEIYSSSTEISVISRWDERPDQVLLMAGRELRSLHFDAAGSRWQDEGTLADIAGASRVAALMGHTVEDLWLTTFDSGAFRLHFAPGTRTPEVISYHDLPGPLRDERWTNMTSGANGPLLMATRSKLHRFNDTTKEFEVATEYGPFAQGNFRFETLTASNDGGLWVVGHPADDVIGPQVAGLIRPASGGQPAVFHPLDHKIADAFGSVLNFRFLINSPTRQQPAMVVGTNTALVRLDLTRWPSAAAARPFSTRIRRAVTLDQEGASSHRAPILQEPLPYARNTVRFEFAANTYAIGANLHYQTRLANFGNGQWSDYQAAASVDYLNLPEGNYTFEVRARNADGQVGQAASLSFRVLPPWQRTPLAYALYGLIAAAALYALVRWRGWQLRRRNVALEALVQTRTRELVRARDDADTANRAKSAFLANMSHELRTPLNAILGYSQILLGNAALPARSREQIAVIDQSGEHLLTLINEVLDLAKVEAGKLTLHAADFPLAALLDEAGAAFRPRLVEKSLAFQDERGADLPTTVHTDRDRLRQVLFNLLSNAVKFTRRGGVRMEVTSTDQAGAAHLRFAVADTGIGIDAGELGKVFEAFHQVNDRTLAAQGTGLGLAISQRLVQGLGGTLQVESAPGQGSRFWFDLPLTTVAPGSVPRAAGTAPDGASNITGYQGAVRRLLVVDDQPENRRVLRDLLVPLGFAVEEAADGTTCLEQCARSLPDAVLLDLRLGQPDGFEVARTLRQHPADGAALVIIALSASVFENDRQQALEAGCDDFLPKPFRTPQVLATLGRLLALQWTYATETPTTSKHGEMDGQETFSDEDVEELLALSGRGDILGLRARLEAWQASDGAPGRASLVRELLPLAASYQVDELHARLLALRRTT